MIDIFLILYGIIGLLTIRPVAGHLAYGFFEKEKQKYSTLTKGRTGPNGEQWFGSAMAAIGFATIWPLMFGFMLQGKAIQIGAEASHKKKELQQRVNELERELL